jgi:hypothetical protein
MQRLQNLHRLAIIIHRFKAANPFKSRPACVDCTLITSLSFGTQMLCNSSCIYLLCLFSMRVTVTLFWKVALYWHNSVTNSTLWYACVRAPISTCSSKSKAMSVSPCPRSVQGPHWHFHGMHPHLPWKKIKDWRIYWISYTCEWTIYIFIITDDFTNHVWC